MSNITFENRVAIITGAGGGLGRTYALELARRGAAVVVNDLGCTYDGLGVSRSMADAVVDEIKAAGGQAVASADSVTTSTGGKAIVQTALDAFGRMDVLINNAGSLRNAEFDELSDDLIDQMIDVHLKGAFHVTRPAFHAMKKQRYGRIVMTSSAAGLFGNHQQAAYAAAKAGLIGLMNVLSLEGAAYGIRCNALLPTAESRMSAALDPSLLKQSTAAFTTLGERLGNSTKPEFVTPLVTYLASEHCQSSHCMYSATLGRYARVFVGMAPGWQGPRLTPASAEDIAEHFEQIRNSDGFSIPGSLMEEFELLAAQGS